uniref:Integrase catalytic domain-containing protein n=1 Tax=Tanacetum cinerariifolium TaxID=118510 RepID=A0A6L2P699_TANCI|nr:hypothetical protein [Tanacetum cinerariifolium]
MDQQNPTLAKIPILDTGKFEQWQFRIQQYLQHEHYALWEVIEFGDSYQVPKDNVTIGSTSDGTGKKKGRTVALTTDDMQKRKNDVKAGTTLLLALPDEHQLRFSKHKTAQELWVAILKTFDGNEATKKTKKNLLKQQYDNFKAEGSETLDLAPEWLMHTIAWRNRNDLDTMSLDDLYNHLKVYESEVQKKSESSSQNMAFISSAKHNSGNEEVNIASVSTASTNVSTASFNIGAASISQDTACAYIASQSNGSQTKFEDINQIDEDHMEEMDIKCNMALLSMRADRFWKKTGKKITIQGTDMAEFDKSKVECFNWHKMGHFVRKCRAPKSQDRGRKDNYRQGSKIEEQAPKALMAIDEDLSWTRLPEFADDTVTDYSRPSPTVESTIDDLQNRNPSVTKTGASPSTIISKPFIKFVKAADRPTENKTYKGETVKKPTVKSMPPKPAIHKPYKRPIRPMRPKMNAAHPNRTSFYKPAHSYSKRPFQRTSTVRSQFRAPWVPTVNRNFPTVNRIFPTVNRKIPTGSTKFSTADMGKKGNAVKASACGCKITGKGTIKTGKLEFENVYFVKDLKTPRQHNMYTIDLNNIVPHKDITCLVAKASADEENLKELRVKIIRCDNGGKFRNKEMNDFCSKKGIKRESSNARTPQLNGVAERRNRTLIEAARTMLADAKLPVTFWAEAVNTACYVQNRVLVNKYQNKTPYELFNGKFEAKGDEGYFLGYSMSRKAFRVFNKRTKREEENLHVDFLENKQIEKGAGPNWLFDIDSLTNSMNYVPVVVAAMETPILTVSSPVPTACLNDSPELSSDTRLISKRVTNQDDTPSLDNRLSLTNRFEDILGVTTNTDDTNGVEADLGNMETTITASPTPTLRIHKDHLKSIKDVASQAVKKDVSSLRYIALSNWFHEAHMETRNSDGCNADDPESSGISNPTATSKVPSAEQVEPTVSLTVETEIPTVSSPVPTVCLDISPESLSGPRIISKGDFSQKETPSLGNALTLSNRFENTFGEEADLSNMETSILEEPKKIFDALKDPSWVESMQEELLQFEIQNVWIFVDCPKGMDVKSAFLYGTIDEEVYVMQPPGFQDPEFPDRVYKVEKAIHCLSENTKDNSCLSKCNTPMDMENPWRKDGPGKDVGLHLYRSMIGSLMYLTASRPDIMFAVCACARHQVTPKECRLHAVKRIFRYLKGHPKLGLWYPKESPFDMCKKQTIVATSTTKAEYVAAAGGCGQVMWIQNQMLDYVVVTMGIFSNGLHWDSVVNTCIIFLHGSSSEQMTHEFMHVYLVFASVYVWIGNFMAKLAFCDYHNMIAILEKTEHNIDFHQIVDFLEASHIRLSMPCEALSKEISSSILLLCIIIEDRFHTAKTFDLVWIWLGGDYGNVFLMGFNGIQCRQFWSTAKIETTEEGTKILATVDGKLRTVSESSIRRNLKLNDEAGISSLSDAKLFENLQLMGYNILPNQKFTFQKRQFSHQWKYLIHTIMQCLSPKSTGFNEFSSNITTALVCLATNRVYNFSKMIFDGMGEGSGTPTESHHTPTSEASQSSQHELPSPSLPPVTTATISPVIPTSPLPTVIPTDTTLLRHYTRRARIGQSLSLLPVVDEPASPIGDDSQGEACPTDSALAADQDRVNIAKTSTLPSDSTPRVTSLAADEGSMQQKLDELTALCTSLQRQQSEMVSRFEAQELEINSLKARIKLLKDKDKGVAEQSGDDAPIKGRSLDKREEAAERISDDTEEMATVLTSMDAASILTSGGVQVVPTAAEVATATVSIPTGSGVVSTTSPIIPTAAPIFTTATESTLYTRRKGKEKMVESDTPKKKKLQEQIDVQEYEQIPKDLSIIGRIELISDLVKYQEKYAQVLKYQTLQRKPRSKKQKKDYYMAVIKGHVGWKTKDFKGMSFEQIEAKFNTVLKQIEDFIPMGSKEVAEMFKRKGLRLEQESVKKLKILEEVPEDVKSSEEVLEEKVKEMMQLVPIEGVYVEALQVKHPIIDWKLWELVKETLSIRPATIEWKLYDMCGVHHVTSKDKEIFMLVEKDYPLRKGLAIVMISYKLQVENYSQMANDLILKIYKIASSPRQQDD